ncbi:TetR/AcrR family transcriptional regulator [Bowmanella dokdonensis]|uniref:TetR/AcrR family transcriptional regulator n=1 Tax=Bowmanella dokdonensis TaxID=751969 RepID=A0A939DPZ3_9ALTE|nr:TetR/AcrR family transcriptional regulator [Bowmanella dokdonensis]MBN7826227.1 TetR/AcrR family transcriptional regulator [Bowmanella dokdonensis]
MNIRFGCKNSGPSDGCLFRKIKTKRQLAIADREQELLSLAERLMAEEGFSGLTMDKLVAACSYSKGTVYNHFSSKEDLLCALCIKCMETELTMFSQALTFEGNSREKLLAVCYAYRLHAVLNPTLFYCVLTAKTPAVSEKAKPERLQRQQELEQQLADICNHLFEHAMAAGDLQSPPAVPLSQLSFAAWAMAFGSNALLLAAGTTQLLKELQAENALLFNINLLLDGMGWQPLSRDWDYKASWQKIGQEVFKQELSTFREQGMAPGQRGKHP